MHGNTTHIMLSSVGLRGPKTTTYCHGGATADAQFSAFGVFQLLSAAEKPGEIWFLLTPQARESAWDEIQKEGRKHHIPVRAIDLPANAVDDTADFLEITATKIPANVQLTLDVTQGLRHHAFLFYALALYLTNFRDVEIQGAWYCRLETDDPNAAKPLINLKPVLELAKWFHALGVFRETGSLKAVAPLVNDNRIKAAFDEVSTLFLTGLPLEAGAATTRLLELSKQRGLLPQLPLRDELTTELTQQLRPLARQITDGQSKKELRLDADELQRQAVFIERYFASGQLNLAFGLLREWIVNRIALKCDESENWLDRKSREPIERQIGGIAKIRREKTTHPGVRESFSKSVQEWANRWNRIIEQRNLLQHHGMKAAEFVPNGKGIRQAHEDFGKQTGWSEFAFPGGGSGKLLVSALGQAKGVLYSAIRHTKPDRVLVVCSDASAGSIDEAINAATGADATLKRPEVCQLKMDCPHTGIGEFPELIKTAAAWLFKADSVVVNHTGGTTLMGVLIGQLRDRAQREYQREIENCVLIDKRPVTEQHAAPWTLSEKHTLRT